MTADEKHISKLAGDMKYDKKHHGSPAKHKPMSGREHIHNKGSVSYKGDATFEKAKKKGGKVIPAGKPYESRDAYLKDSTRNEKHNAAPEMHCTGKRKK